MLKNHFVKNRWTLILAESCTGGSLAAKLTLIPGCSDYFLGSLVTYSNELKSKLLGVSPDLIQEFGAVSKEVAEAMAKGALNVGKSDFALAITGIAGPAGGSPNKPVGTMWAAICQRESKPYVWSFHVKGSREQVLTQTVDILLEELLRFCENN